MAQYFQVDDSTTKVFKTIEKSPAVKAISKLATNIKLDHLTYATIGSPAELRDFEPAPIIKAVCKFSQPEKPKHQLTFMAQCLELPWPELHLENLAWAENRDKARHNAEHIQKAIQSLAIELLTFEGDLDLDMFKIRTVLSITIKTLMINHINGTFIIIFNFSGEYSYNVETVGTI